MKQLQRRILLLLTVIFSGFGLLFYFFTSSLTQDQFFEQQQQAIQTELRLLESQLAETIDNPEEATRNLQRAAEVAEERITFIDTEGEVVFDTHADVETTENHADRIEVQTALTTGEMGTDIRQSETTNVNLYYAALPVESSDGETIGVLRVSKPINEMENVFSQISRSLLWFVGFSVLLVIFFTNLWSKRFSKPMGEIEQVANRLSNRDYEARYRSRSFREVDHLGHTMNTLAENLSEQVREIERNDRQLTELVQNLVIGVMLLNSEKKIEMTNPAMEALMGQNLQQKKGTHYIELITNYSLLSLIDRAFEEKEIQNKEISLFFPDERIVDAHVVPYENKLTNEWNAIVLLYNISNIRRLEKIRSDFVANASHELRTPVTALKGFTETLLDGAMEDKETLVEFLEIILKESNRLDAIVQDILDLSKLENQAVPFQAERINLTQLIEETVHMLQRKVDEKQIAVLREIPEGLTYLGDKNRLKQIVLNLLDNALSYTPVKGKVTIRVRLVDNEMILTVRDTGIGISNEQQKRIFERFYRVDTARSRNSGGTGLGLSIVKHLVENLKGTIEVDSAVGKGTSFIVKLPVSPNKAVEKK